LIDRRQVIAGTAAVAIAAAIPAVAVVAQAADPAVDRMKTLLHQFFGLLRSEGFAVAKLQDGGKILFWLHDRADIASMQMMSLDDDATPDVVEVLERVASIEPTLVRL
jgi:hypothetical protein